MFSNVYNLMETCATREINTILVVLLINKMYETYEVLFTMHSLRGGTTVTRSIFSVDYLASTQCSKFTRDELIYGILMAGMMDWIRNT
jgi:hypothetical protein